MQCSWLGALSDKKRERASPVVTPWLSQPDTQQVSGLPQHGCSRRGPSGLRWRYRYLQKGDARPRIAHKKNSRKEPLSDRFQVKILTA